MIKSNFKKIACVSAFILVSSFSIGYAEKVNISFKSILHGANIHLNAFNAEANAYGDVKVIISQENKKVVCDIRGNQFDTFYYVSKDFDYSHPGKTNNLTQITTASGSVPVTLHGGSFTFNQFYNMVKEYGHGESYYMSLIAQPPGKSFSGIPVKGSMLSVIVTSSHGKFETPQADSEDQVAADGVQTSFAENHNIKSDGFITSVETGENYGSCRIA